MANAAHELRTPLTVERTLLQVALADPDAGAVDLRGVCEELLASGRDHEQLLDSLLTLATGERGLERHEPVDLGANLLDNAIVYNEPRGRISLRTAADGDGAMLAVANTGQRVPPAEVERLFEPFKRLRGERTAGNGHHGLGLSIVRAVASAHGATVTADPGANGGLTVAVAFRRLSDPQQLGRIINS